MYIGRTGLACGTGADGAGGAIGGAAASAPLVVNGAPQYRQNRDVSLFIVPHASQRIEWSRARIPASGFELWVGAKRRVRNPSWASDAEGEIHTIGTEREPDCGDGAFDEKSI